MARQRMVKPEFFRDRRIAELGSQCAIVYQVLWVAADDGGVARADPDLIYGEFLSRWPEFTIATLTECLNRLSEASRIRLYQIGDDLYAEIPTLVKHQKINRPSSFRHPRDGQRVTRIPHGGDPEPSVSETHPPLTEPSCTAHAPITNAVTEATTSSDSVGKPTEAAPRVEKSTNPTESAERPARLTRPPDDPDDLPGTKLIDAVRRCLYVPDGKPPDDWAMARDVTILRALRRRRRGTEILAAIEGLALLRERGAIDWIPPGTKATMKALYTAKHGPTTMFTAAVSAYDDAQDTRPPSAAERTDPTHISASVDDVLARKGARA